MSVLTECTHQIDVEPLEATEASRRQWEVLRAIWITNMLSMANAMGMSQEQ